MSAHPFDSPMPTLAVADASVLPPAGALEIEHAGHRQAFVYTTDDASWVERRQAIADGLTGGYDPWSPRRLIGDRLIRVDGSRRPRRRFPDGTSAR
jgi:hypothetical protein